jgi:AMMECR1 domain-containing protein
MPDKEVFLTRLSLKAGIDPEAWRKGNVTMLVYQAEAFEEGER